MAKQKYAPDTCPNCGSDKSFDWFGYELEGDTIVEECYCDACDTEFVRRYRYETSTYITGVSAD